MRFLVSYVSPPRVNKDEASKRVFKKNKIQFESYNDFTFQLQCKPKACDISTSLNSTFLEQAEISIKM